MSTSAPRASVSVVVGSNGAPGSVARCLAALEPQTGPDSNVEVIVCEATASDDAVALATRELASIGLVDPAKVIDGTKVQVPRAYPMYDGDYRDAVLTLHGYISGFENLKTFGRNGLHRYNNQDHSMWTAILATLNHLDGTEYDVWSVNADAEYHEEGEMVDQLLNVDLGA